MIFVTTYNNPDIDGIACVLGYSELLAKLDRPNKTVYIGKLSKEVDFVKNYTKHFSVEESSGKYPEESEFILLDTSNPESLDPAIDASRVIEIFDHRELVFTGKFVNAKINIEKVGSCATLITELYRKNNLVPSKKTAIYLYSAIISNTVNFKNLVTTQRDADAANWLKPISEVNANYIKEMFEYKSKIEKADDLIYLIDQDFATHNFYGVNIMVAQIEIANLEKVLDQYGNVVKRYIKKLNDREKIDYSMLNAIDIIGGFNILIVLDEKSGELFAKALDLPQFKEQYKTDKIIMRKEIWPKVEKILSTRS